MDLACKLQFFGKCGEEKQENTIKQVNFPTGCKSIWQKEQFWGVSDVTQSRLTKKNGYLREEITIHFIKYFYSGQERLIHVGKFIFEKAVQT
jgi:hypothetical protein